MSSVDVQNHLKAFDKSDLDRTKPLSQTIIRVPLRSPNQAAKSKLFQNVVDPSDIRQALEEFGDEIRGGGLLFLKHIRKVIIRADWNVILQVEMRESDETGAR